MSIGLGAAANFPTLHAVTRSGPEYACVQGWGIFDGQPDQASIDAMRTWHINAVRIPLNEDCWLGINGVDPRWSGAAYQSAIADYVHLLHQNGFFTVVDLHLAAPGTTIPTTHNGFAPMADKDHSLPFWTSVASQYANDPQTAFELFNEPHDISWSVWKSGDATYAGMDELIAAVRATGALNWVLVGGVSYANDLSGWLANRPNDPANKLAATWHVYANSAACVTSNCWDTEVSAVAHQVPIFISELGESDCLSTFAVSVLNWAKKNGIDNYAPWAWDPHYGCAGSSLLADWSGTPTSYGAGIMQWMQSQ